MFINDDPCSDSDIPVGESEGRNDNGKGGEKSEESEESKECEERRELRRGEMERVWLRRGQECGGMRGRPKERKEEEDGERETLRRMTYNGADLTYPITYHSPPCLR